MHNVVTLFFIEMYIYINLNMTILGEMHSDPGFKRKHLNPGNRGSNHIE